VITAILVLAISLRAQDTSAPKVEEQIVGAAKQGNSYVLSPKGEHLATVTQKGSRMVVVLDGVEGPKFDEITNIDMVNQSVLFSPDGARSAYVGRSGDDYVLMVDGKESMKAGNAREMQGQNPVSTLTFTSDSKHLWFLQRVKRKDGGTTQAVVWDGAQEIPGGTTPVVSSDCEHHAYVAVNPTDSNQQTVVLDGKPAGYAGQDPKFSGDGKHLFVRTYVKMEKGNGQALEVLVDGKPFLKAQEAVIYPAPVGEGVVSVVRRSGANGQECFLVIAGKKIDGSEAAAIDRVAFSPDGKRYAAECRSAAGATFVVVDGKKGQQYQNVANVAFSPDSSRCAYQASLNGKTFVVIDDDESDGYLTVQNLMFGGGGKRTAYLGQTDPNAKVLVIDGKPSPVKAVNYTEVQFSDDGAHVACLMPANNANAMHLVLDGHENAEMNLRQFQCIPSGPQASFVISRDGKHVAAFATGTGNDPKQGLWLDGKLVQATPNLTQPTFTPDGKHLFWLTTDRTNQQQVFADGVACAQFAGGFLIPSGRTWEMGDDGALTVLAQDGEKLRRLRITPSSSAGVETLVANASAKPGK
jgi:Tol biopolymer transport system component